MDKIKTLGAAQVKSRFLGLIDEVQTRKLPLRVTKNGKPTVIMHPAVEDADPLAIYRLGGVTIVGDILGPASDPADWEYD